MRRSQKPTKTSQTIYARDPARSANSAAEPDTRTGLDGGAAPPDVRGPQITGRLRRGPQHAIVPLVCPDAFAGASALAQARAEGIFTRVHEVFWVAANERKCTKRSSNSPVASSPTDNSIHWVSRCQRALSRRCAKTDAEAGFCPVNRLRSTTV